MTLKSTTKITLLLICGVILACGDAAPVRAQVIFAPHDRFPQRECRDLSAIDAAKLRMLATTLNPFWTGGEEQQQAYLAALNGGERGAYQFQARYLVNIGDKAAIILAAIAKGNLTLLQDNYNDKVDEYFIKHSGTNTLYWMSICNFVYGAKFLLTQGINPNAVRTMGISPFNVSLLYPHSRIPHLLLEYHYSISHNYKWCKSSKYILRLYKDGIDSAVAAKIEEAVCQKR